MRLPGFKSKGQQVRVLRAIPSSKARNGTHFYEIQPTSYGGPGELAPGTELEIVSTPKKRD